MCCYCRPRPQDGCGNFTLPPPPAGGELPRILLVDRGGEWFKKNFSFLEKFSDLEMDWERQQFAATPTSAHQRANKVQELHEGRACGDCMGPERPACGSAWLHDRCGCSKLEGCMRGPCVEGALDTICRKGLRATGMSSALLAGSGTCLCKPPPLSRVRLLKS